jgi:hypothetical protein
MLLALPLNLRWLFLSLLLAWPAGASAESAADGLSITPDKVVLRGQSARQQLVVTRFAAGQSADVTRRVKFQSESPAVVAIDDAGVITPVADGRATVSATLDGQTAKVDVVVSDSGRPSSVQFELDVLPIFGAFGCNSGACHGKARGQNGFQLSLLGFDANFDYDAVALQARGRRVFPASPDNSLLLRKAAARLPHGGGERLKPGSPAYETLRTWIAAGMPRAAADAPKLTRISVFPTERKLPNQAEQQLLVTAHFSDGSTRDVTAASAYQSNESVYVSVDEHGLMRTGPLAGEATIMARYMGSIATCHVLIPLPDSVPSELYAALPRQNLLDELVWNKLQKLGITPSTPASDATFLRRAHLDLIGRLPNADEVRTFLADQSSDKRAQLIDRLLARPEYADHWANKWADLLRPNAYRVGVKATRSLDVWIREAFRRNLPYDQFVRDLLTAKGSTYRNGATTLFRDRRDPDEITNMVSQLFLGIRLECAKCHHHPFEVWGQDDFYSLAAYFARVARKGTGLSPPISAGEEMVYTAAKGSVKHPLTGEVLPPRPLFGKAPEIGEDDDPREALAAWMTSPENPYFAQVAVNRIWAELMGRGIVDPVDDLRATNPPSNAPLLEALALEFRRLGFDQKRLLRLIMTSYVYGLSSEPTERNVADTRNYSRHYRVRLRAEVLLDAVTDFTQVPEAITAIPPGSRSNEIWTHRATSLFLDSFGRPDPNQDPPCERTTDTTVVQTLHLMNSPNLHRKVTSDLGKPAQLAASDKSSREIVEELYLAVYSRLPTAEEYEVALGIFPPGSNAKNVAGRRLAAEDLLWGLINTPEFIFKD